MWGTGVHLECMKLGALGGNGGTGEQSVCGTGRLWGSGMWLLWDTGMFWKELGSTEDEMH